jgi:hypothetical protein
MDEDHVLPDGSALNIHAAGPHKHLSDFYVFVMERDQGDLQFPDSNAEASLRRITIRGNEAPPWQENLTRWLPGCEAGPGSLRIGEVELIFEQDETPSLRAIPVFGVPGSSAELELPRGLLELRQP